MKMLKKISSLLIILSLCMVVGLCCNTIVASASTTPDGFEYEIKDGAAYIKGYTGDAVNLVIPKEIYGYRVAGIGYKAIASNNTIETLTIEASLDSIDWVGFYDCQNLKKVEVTGSIKTVGKEAFQACINLTEVNLKGTEVIGTRAFRGCENLTTINIPDSVVEVDHGAFVDCKKLKSIDLPKSLVKLGEYQAAEVFYGCESLTKINVPSGNVAFTSIDGVVYSKDKTVLVYCPYARTGELTVNVGTNKIARAAFKGSKLSTVIIPEGLTEIEREAFEESTVEKLVLPNSATEFGIDIFKKNEVTAVWCGKGTKSFEFAANNDRVINVDAYIGNFIATVEKSSYTYTGKDIKPVVTLSGVVGNNTVTLVEGTDYEVAYKNCKNIGTATIIITAKDKYVGVLALNYKINPISISKFTANTEKTSYTYTGKDIKPVVTVTGTVEGKTVTLVKGTDYKVSYKNCKNVGTATITITGIGKYTGTLKVNYKINPISISKFTAKAEKTSYTYVGKDIKPSVTLKGTVGGKTVTLVKGTDYKVSYKNCKNVGTATITITGIGKYTGTLKVKYTIKPVSISKYTATIKKTTYTYTGKEIKPTVTVKGKVNGKTVTLKNSTDYKVSYKNNKKTGQATITITGKGNFTGTKTIKFKIKPTQVKKVKAVSKSKSNVKLQWNSCASVTGYEVYRSTGKTYTKVGTVSGTSFKNTGLKSGTAYYYKVRAYKTVGTTKLYGSYSGVYTVKTK